MSGRGNFDIGASIEGRFDRGGFRGFDHQAFQGFEGFGNRFERQFADNFRFEELGILPKMSIHWGDGDSASDSIRKLTQRRIDDITEKILRDIAARFDDHYQFDPYGLFYRYGLKGHARNRGRGGAPDVQSGGYPSGSDSGGPRGGYQPSGGGGYGGDGGGGSGGGYQPGGGGGTGPGGGGSGGDGGYQSGGGGSADGGYQQGGDSTNGAYDAADAESGTDQIVGEVPEGERKELIDQALELAGVPVTPENEAAVNLIIQHESEWVVGAQNNWDHNATVLGTPSKGLMQVIEPTFLDNAIEGFNTDIFDPLSNLIAGIRYAVKRYGSLQNTPGVASMAQGGVYLPY